MSGEQLSQIWLVGAVLVFSVVQVAITFGAFASEGDDRFSLRAMGLVAGMAWPFVAAFAAALAGCWLLFVGAPVGCVRVFRIALNRLQCQSRPSAPFSPPPADPYRSPAPSCEKCGRPLP